MLVCVFTYLLKVTLSFWSVWVCFLGSEGVECPFRLAWRPLSDAKGSFGVWDGDDGDPRWGKVVGDQTWLLSQQPHNDNNHSATPTASPSHIYPDYLSGRLKSGPAGPEQRNSIGVFGVFGVFGAFLAFFHFFFLLALVDKSEFYFPYFKVCCFFFSETKHTLTCDEINCVNLK